MDKMQVVSLSLDYLHLLLNEDKSKVEFIYKDKQNNDINSTSLIQQSASSCELTGNPLEASFFNEKDSKIYSLNTETVYVGFPLKEARKFLNHFRLSENKSDSQRWICCDDKNDENIILLSINDKNESSSSIVYKTGKTNVKSLSEKLFEFKNKHLSLYECLEKQMQCSISCHYDLLNPLELTHNKEDDLSSIGLPNPNIISLILNWKELSFEKPTSGIEAEMMFKIYLDNENSSIRVLYKDLISINNQYLMFKKKNYSADFPGNKKSLQEILSLLRNEFSSSKSKRNINKNINNTLSLYDSIRNIQNSINQTPLKKLWTILTDCQNVGDLSKAIYFVYKEVQNLSLWIDTSENNKLIFVQTTKKIIFEPNFNIDEPLPSQALELLLEMGIHSLKKEYFTLFQNAEFNFHHNELRATSDCTELIPTLGQLHAILEIILNLNNENIDKVILQEICEQILLILRKQYPSLNDILESNSLMYRLKMNYLDIEQSIANYLWKYFRISLHSSNKYMKWNSILLFSDKDIFSNIYSENLFECTFNSEDDMFFTTEMITIYENV